MSRKFSSWIDAYYEYTDLLPSPPLFRKWAGIAIVAGALERKIWVRTLGSNLYPNMYIVLVAPPGVGKTVLTSQAWSMWSELAEEDGHHVASTSVSKASLVDDLRDATRKIVRPQDTPPVVDFNALKVCSNELGVLIPGYDNEFMNTLTDLYDGHPYKERKRTKDLQFTIKAPQLNLLAATTPSYLNHVLPEGAWDQGFLSRTLLIYSGEAVLRDLFSEETQNDKQFTALAKELRTIGKLYGKLTFSPEAAAFISKWHMGKGEPRPDHPKLTHYVTRRTAHLLKLCMVASVSTSDELVITLDHVQDALNWLTEAEAYMPDIFKSMASGGDSRAIEDTWYFAYQIWIKEKKPIQEHRLIHFLQERVPAHSVSRILEIMVRAQILEKELGEYKPRPPRQR